MSTGQSLTAKTLIMQGWKSNQYYFNKKQILPYVDEHWKDLCTERQRTNTWWATLGSCLYSASDIFTSRDEQQRSAAADFTFNDPNLWHIRPVFTSTKTTSIAKEKRKLEDLEQSTTLTDGSLLPVSSNSKRRVSASSISAQPASQHQHMEKWVASNTPSPKPSSPSVTPIITPAMFSSTSSTDHPFNRFGFKYIPCEKSNVLPHLAYRQTDTSNINGHGCTLSVTDKSSYVSVAKDGLTVTTDKGFRMCRANLGVKEGDWYWEATILKGNDDSGGHVRIGWARREACLNAPVGYDAYSYGYRDKTGEKVFCSRPQTYGEPFETGDVIGLYISLPSSPKYNNDQQKDSTTATFKSATRKRIPIAFKDTLWFEEKDYRQCKEMEALADRYRKEDESLYEPKTIPNSSITMYKNGVCLGVMYENLTNFEDFGSLPEMVLSQQQKKKRKNNTKKDASNSGIGIGSSSSSGGGNNNDNDNNNDNENNDNDNNDMTERDTSYSAPSTGVTPRMRMVDDEDFDGNAKHQQWNDDPPLADDGTLGYYPAVSVYKGGMVSCNFGPDFQYSPSDAGSSWKPMCERHSDYMVEECMWDLIDEVSRSFRKKMIE
ncbi:unnamed protein product [Absidia cylindrospora]